MARSTKSKGTIIPFPGMENPEDGHDSAYPEGPEYEDRVFDDLGMTEEDLAEAAEGLLLTREALTLALAYLNADFPPAPREALKAPIEADRNVLATLRSKGLIDYSNKKKTIAFTEEGENVAMQTAITLARMYLHEVTLQQLPVPTFTFRLELDLDGRTCWRRIRVPQTFTFEDFHMAIQDAFGWMDYHMYDFRLMHNRQKLVITDLGRGAIDSMFSWRGPSENKEDALDMELCEVFPRTRKAKYSYDYGDGWEISITYVREESWPITEAIFCEDGEGDAPPEDVGGQGGYEDFLRIIDDPDDEEYEETVAWGESQGFERFSLESINERLKDATPPVIYGAE